MMTAIGSKLVPNGKVIAIPATGTRGGNAQPIDLTLSTTRGEPDAYVTPVLNALADPLRLEIVRKLSEHDEQCPYDFLPMTSKQNLVHHFKVLREAGLVKSRYEGRNKFTRLRRDLIDDMFPGLIDSILSAAPKP